MSLKQNLLLLAGILVLLFFVLSTSKSDPIQNYEPLQSVSDYSFWETTESKEYIDFLNELDSNENREIVSVSNSSYAFKYTGPYNIYTVTYKVYEGSQNKNIHYKYSIFEAESEEELTDFLNTLSDEFEIFNISIATYAFEYTGPYHSFIVTYRNPL